MMMLFMASVLIIGNKSDRPRLYNAWLIWKGLVLITRLFSATYLILMIAKYVHKVSILEDYTRIPVLRDVFQQKTPESFSLFMTMTSIILEIHFWQIIYYGKRYLIDRHSDEERRFKKFFHSQSDDNSRSYFIIREEDEEEFLRSRINSV
uniref:Uncharacterized protein n=2 Tax=Bursaphelenchus xylophilus TaxID=6326 RepID=A0A1I7SIF5_BURXY